MFKVYIKKKTFEILISVVVSESTGRKQFAELELRSESCVKLTKLFLAPLVRPLGKQLASGSPSHHPPTTHIVCLYLYLTSLLFQIVHAAATDPWGGAAAAPPPATDPWGSQMPTPPGPAAASAAAPPRNDPWGSPAPPTNGSECFFVLFVCIFAVCFVFLIYMEWFLNLFMRLLTVFTF